MRKHAQIKIYGKVQGVRFRWSTKEIAKHLGLVGFVKNMSDGSVYIEAEGEENELAEFIDWCSVGPLLADVSNVDVHISNDLKGFIVFESFHRKNQKEMVLLAENRYLL